MPPTLAELADEAEWRGISPRPGTTLAWQRFAAALRALDATALAGTPKGDAQGAAGPVATPEGARLLRETAKSVVADVQRYREMYPERNTYPPRDWSCSECGTNSDLLTPGFICAWHRLKAFADSGGALPAEGFALAPAPAQPPVGSPEGLPKSPAGAGTPAGKEGEP